MLSRSTRLTSSSEECFLSPCYVWYTRHGEPKDNVHLFSQVLQCRSPLRYEDHQRLKRRSSFCLSSWPLQIMSLKRWNVAATTGMGHAEDSYGLGGQCGSPPTDPPLTGYPLPLWPLNNEPFWGALHEPTQPFNPWPDLVSDWSLGEVRAVPHASSMVTVRYETVVCLRLS